MSVELERQHLRKLNSILHSNLCFFVLFLVSILYIFFYSTITHSKYRVTDSFFEGIVLSKKMTNNVLTLELKAKEKLLVQYPVQKEEKEQNIEIGDKIQVIGTLQQPNQSRNFGLFQYQEYLKGKQIFWIVKAKTIKPIQKSRGFYFLKSQIIKRLEQSDYASYFYAFLLGDSTELQRKNEYQELGISHLFAVSGMHILFISSFLLWFFKKVCKKELQAFLCVSIVLAFYVWLLSDSPSANRAYFLFLLSFLNKYYHWNMKPLQLLTIVFMVSIFKNPFSYLQIGFQFSFLICFFFMLQKKIETSYFKSLFSTSIFAFLVSLPLSVYHFNQIHFGTIFFNLFAVPFVSVILFPFSFLTFFFSFLEPVFSLLLFVFHTVIDWFQIFSFLKVSFCSVSLWFVFGYYIVLFFYTTHHKKWGILYLGMMLLHIVIPYLDSNYWIDMIDVGQGDAIVIRYPHLEKTILIDCGGILPYQKSTASQVDHILIPYFKTLGVKKIDVLILTHGDYDHMGNASELIEKFPVKEIIMNSGADSELEKDFIKTQKIPITKVSKKNIRIGTHIFQFLNFKKSQTENEDSLIFYTKLADKNILFMGDAGKISENELIQEYHLPKMDILKVGHHGSKSSSSMDFLKVVSPKISLISAGVNNSFGHPSLEVVKRLQETGEVYVTNEVGSIRIKLKKNRPLFPKTRYPLVAFYIDLRQKLPLFCIFFLKFSKNLRIFKSFVVYY